jgi:hypothetical protein
METPSCGKRGFEILQNVENRKVLQHDAPKLQDFILQHSINKLNMDKYLQRKTRHHWT